MRHDDLPWSQEGDPGWVEGQYRPEDPRTPPAPPYGWVAPRPDDTPTVMLPGGAPSWAMSDQRRVPPALPAPPPPPKRKKGVSRRAVLVGAGVGTVGLGALGVGLGTLLSHGLHASSLAPDIDTTGQILYLLRRAGFGARPSELSTYTALGVRGSIDRLLDPASVPDTLDSQLNSLGLDLTRVAGMQRWFMLHMLNSPRPLEEKMTLFWHGVLTSSYHDVGGIKNYSLLLDQNKLLRAHALGRFDDLIKAITLDPAMMWYLDLRTSTGRAPNENYARELMELFTLGLDLNGVSNYTQADVVAGARALTGWTLRSNRPVFVPARHDSGVKTLLGHTGNLGLDDVVNIVCNHPATPWHVAWRMWNFFAYEKSPDITTSDPDLKPMVDAYHSQNHSIAAMMRALLTSPGFWSAKAYRQRVKSPAEFLVGAIRALEVPTNANGLPAVLTAMGQELFSPPNVSGWDGDKTSSSWMSTQAWMTRVNFVNALLKAATGGTTNGGAGQAANATSVLQQQITAHQIASPAALVDFFSGTLLDGQLAADRKDAVSSFLASAAQQAGGPHLQLHGGGSLPAAAARSALYLLMSMPEYQLN